MALSESVFVEKMEKLNSTQESIENTSTWCSLWRSDARRIVAWWENYFAKANMNKRMCMVYLASDVMLNSRKKGPEFVHELYKVLPRALRHFLSKADAKSAERVQKVVRVWEERKVFGSSGAKSLQELIQEAEAPKRAVPPTPLGAAATAVAAAEAAAGRAVEAGAAVAAARAAHDQPAALRGALAVHSAALREEVALREAARAALQAAADAHAEAGAGAAAAAAAVEADLAAISAALSPVAPAGPGGVEGTVDAAEAAALAAQLMQNPQALLEAIAATMQPGAGGGGEGAGAPPAAPAPAEEYDPAEMW